MFFSETAINTDKMFWVGGILSESVGWQQTKNFLWMAWPSRNVWYSNCSKILNTSCKKVYRQTARTQISLFLKKPSDQGLPCLLFSKDFLNSSPDKLGPVVQLVESQIADPGVMSFIRPIPVFLWILIVKYFLLRSFSSFCWFKKGCCQLHVHEKVCHRFR